MRARLTQGTLRVVHARTWFPRSLLHRFHLPMAILQQLSLIVQEALAIYGAALAKSWPMVYRALSSVPPHEAPDIYIVDQLSVGVPLLRLVCGRRVLFSCHFPDKEISMSLANQRGAGRSMLRRMYRWPLDMLEELTTACADALVANSHFTAGHFHRVFPHIHRVPHVVYPGVDEEAYEPARVSAAVAQYEREACGSDGRLLPAHEATRLVLHERSRPTFLSINRFEAKKNVALAVDAFARVRSETADTSLRLIVAGGFDSRIRDNVETLAALETQAERLSLPHVTIWSRPAKNELPPPRELIERAAVVFFPSFPGPLLHALMLTPSTRALLYTPTNEHFGIVPLEAMACGRPVVATSTGGPLETVVDAAVDAAGKPQATDATGFLLPPDAAQWAQACRTILEWDDATVARIGAAARARVTQHFSVRAMRAGFEREVQSLDGVVPLRERVQLGALLLCM